MSLKVGKIVGNSSGSQRQMVQRQQYRVLDEAARKRRNRQQLEQLERDNFHDDPHANLVMHKKAPKFDEHAKPNSFGGQLSSSSVKRHALPRSRMLSFQQLLEEDSKSPEPNYMSVMAPSPSNVSDDPNKVRCIPKRRFCSVCGFVAPYTCITCGMRFCSIACNSTHKDTRCLKWTA